MALRLYGNGTIENLNAANSGIATTSDLSLKADNSDGYRYRQTIIFESSGVFSKNNYPWLKGIKVKMQAAGGGGTGNASNGNVGRGGSGGGYGEFFIDDITLLSNDENITVGAGGSSSSSYTTASGGGNSSAFGNTVTGGGPGATWGDGRGNGGPGGVSSGNSWTWTFSHRGGFGGGRNGGTYTSGDSMMTFGSGGESFMSGSSVTGAQYASGSGGGLGGGGSAGGAYNAVVSGGNGGNGIIILELYS